MGGGTGNCNVPSKFQKRNRNAFIRGAVFIRGACGAPRGMPRQAAKQLRTHACTGNCIELLKQYSWVHWELSAGLATSTVFNSFEKHGLLQYENNVVRDSILQETLTVRGSLFEVGHDLSDGRKNKLHNSNN